MNATMTDRAIPGLTPLSCGCRTADGSAVPGCDAGHSLYIAGSVGTLADWNAWRGHVGLPPEADLD